MSRLNDWVIIANGGIGDNVALTATIKPLRKICPGRLIVRTIPERKVIFENNPLISEVNTTMAFPRSLSSEKFRFFDANYGRFKPNTNGLSSSECLFRCVGLKWKGEKPELYLSQKHDAFGKKFLQKKGPYCVIQTTGSCPQKMWPRENWADFVKRARSKNYTIVEIGGLPTSGFIGTYNFCGKTPLGQTFSIIKYCTILVATDSFSLHVAKAFDRPCLILFGPSNPSVVQDKKLVPVHKNVCPPCLDESRFQKCSHKNCMWSITRDDVYEKFIQTMTRFYKKQ